MRAAGRTVAPKGCIITTSFELEGQKRTALNGGLAHKFTEANSFVVGCDSQEGIEVDGDKPSAGGSEIQCGWRKDKFELEQAAREQHYAAALWAIPSKGRKRVKTVPLRPGRREVRTRKIPSWRSTISWLTHRPRPVPATPLVLK